MIKRSLVVES